MWSVLTDLVELQGQSGLLVSRVVLMHQTLGSSLVDGLDRHLVSALGLGAIAVNGSCLELLDSSLQCGEISISDKHYVATINTDIVEVYDFCNKILQMLYGDYCTLEITDDYAINKRVYYEISFPKDKSEEILLDCGVLERGSRGKIWVHVSWLKDNASRHQVFIN